jgi:outer membrane protein TolC
MRRIAIALLLAPALATADPKKLTFDDVLAKALAGPKAKMADGDRESAASRVDEADASRYPKVKASSFITISPEIHCEPNPQTCIATSPQNFAFRFSGLYIGGQLDFTQPIYTFGKISHARAAARAGVEAQDALADEAAGDIASDAARAYWGVKLSRELIAMLDDGIEEIGKALTQMEDKKGGKPVSIQDRQRVAVLLAEAKAQRADAAQAEAQALAGLRALVGMPDADIDDAVLAPVKHDLQAASGEQRPQAKAARAGAVAAGELAEFEASYFWPDVAIVGSAIFAKAQGADDPPSAFAYDPYNRFGFGAVIAAQWQADLWNTKPRVDRARAEAHKARAQSDLAAAGARYDAETALAEARGAADRLAAAGEGEKAARTWVASVLQGEAIGTLEARDLADSYIAWFQMRARWATAVFQFNTAVVRLDRATGEFGAGGRRPKEK